MNEDQQTYQRAKTSALLGLGVQVLMTLVLLISATWMSQFALYGAMVHALGGVGIWICLWLVYQQHRLERLETLEAEQLAARHGEDSSIFEVGVDDLSVARRRLQMLYKWVVPLTSAATALYLVVAGLVLTNLVSDRLGAEQQALPEQVLVLLAVCAGLALVAFLVSRYLAGMAKLPQWQLLRGGATYLMGNVVVVGLLAAAFALAHFEYPALLRYMVIIVPVLMIVVGVEMALNLVLNFYRPRKPGEVPRPAFESRLLGLLTTPESIAKTINETINYQFGFEVTRSWFWQLLSRVFVSLVLFAAGVLVLLTCVVVVEPTDNAMITRFGALQEERLEPGVHFKLPWPLSRAHYFDVTTIEPLFIGAEAHEGGAILWTNMHGEEEVESWVVAPPRDEYTDPEQAMDADGELREVTEEAPDVFLVNAEMVLYYRVDEERLTDYLRSSQDAGEDGVGERLRHIAERELGRHLLRHDIDEWIGTARVDAGRRIREAVQAVVDAQHLGVEVTDVVIPSVHPPQEVAASFHAVIGAGLRRQTAMQRAEQQAIQRLSSVAGSPDVASRIVAEIEKHERLRSEGATEEELLEQELLVEQLMQQAGGQASVLIAEARGARWEREATAHGDAVRFPAQLLSYEASPELFRTRRYLQVLEEGLEGTRKYLIAGDRDHLTIRGDLKETDSGVDAALDLLEQGEGGGEE